MIDNHPIVTVRDGVPLTIDDLPKIEQALTLVAVFFGIRINTPFRRMLRKALSHGMRPEPDASEAKRGADDSASGDERPNQSEI